MTRLTPAGKRHITEDWRRLFPGFGVYEAMWLARRVGPLVQGIALESNSTHTLYCPVAHMHNLCRPFSVVSFALAQYLPSKRTGAKDSIPVELHKDQYEDAARRLAEACLLPLGGDLTTTQVVDAQRELRRLHRTEKYPVRLFEDGILLLAWANQNEKAVALLDEYVSEMRGWPPHVMESFAGGLLVWEKAMLANVGSSDALRATAEAQAQELKVAGLPFSNLIAA